MPARARKHRAQFTGVCHETFFHSRVRPVNYRHDSSAINICTHTLHYHTLLYTSNFHDGIRYMDDPISVFLFYLISAKHSVTLSHSHPQSLPEGSKHACKTYLLLSYHILVTTTLMFNTKNQSLSCRSPVYLKSASSPRPLKRNIGATLLQIIYF